MVNTPILLLTNQTLLAYGFKLLVGDSIGTNSVNRVSLDELKKVNIEQHNTLVVDTYSYDLDELHPYYNHTKIVVILHKVNHKQISKVLNANVQVCVTASCSKDEINKAVMASQNNERFYCKRVLDAILDSHSEQPKSKKAKPSIDGKLLSDREEEITGLIASGLTNKEIASKLYLSVHTVNTHRKNIMRKLGVKSVSDLVQYAIRTNIIKN